jgi:hypothetical protein
MVYHSGGPTDLDSVFRATWDYLRQIGVDAAGHRVKEPSRAYIDAVGGKPANPEVLHGRTVKTVTSASDPIRPTSGSPAAGHKDPSDMTQAEYEAWRRKSA